ELGTEVTVRSSDPSKLLISTVGSGAGSASVTIPTTDTDRTFRYYLQALSDAGEVSYTVSAPGHTDTTAKVTLVKTGLQVFFRDGSTIRELPERYSNFRSPEPLEIRVGLGPALGPQPGFYAMTLRGGLEPVPVEIRSSNGD